MCDTLYNIHHLPRRPTVLCVSDSNIKLSLEAFNLGDVCCVDMFVVQLDVLVNFGLLGTVLWEYWCMFTGSSPADVFNLEQYDIHRMSIVQSAFAGQYSMQSLLDVVGTKLAALSMTLLAALEVS